LLYERTLPNNIESMGDNTELLPWTINPFTFFDKRLALRMFFSSITVGTGSQVLTVFVRYLQVVGFSLVLLKIQVFWVVMLWCWVHSIWCFKGSQCPHLQGEAVQGVVSDCLTLRMKTIQWELLPSFDVSLTVHLNITLDDDQLNAQIFLIHLLRSSTCTCFEQYLAHPQEVKLY